MAPEQLSGGEITARSDIYALGLVLYEMFTGKRALEGKNLAELIHKREQMGITPPSAVVRDLSPQVESGIMRCLQPEPDQRPASALAVSASLPGGDPLAAALAAGETPSPDMVAAAGGTDVVPARWAFAAAAWIVLSLAVIVLVYERVMLINRIPTPKSPAALQDRAVEALGKLGYGPGVDSAWGLGFSLDYARFIERTSVAPDRWSRLAADRPATLFLWYRTSPRPLIPLGTESDVTGANPPRSVAGMTLISVDSSGRLAEFVAVPEPIQPRGRSPLSQLANGVRRRWACSRRVCPGRAAMGPDDVRGHADGVGGSITGAAGASLSHRGGGVRRPASLGVLERSLEPVVPLSSDARAVFQRRHSRAVRVDHAGPHARGRASRQGQRQAWARRSPRRVPGGHADVRRQSRELAAGRVACRDPWPRHGTFLRRDRSRALRRRFALADVPGLGALRQAPFTRQPDRLDATDCWKLARSPRWAGCDDRCLRRPGDDAVLCRAQCDSAARGPTGTDADRVRSERPHGNAGGFGSPRRAARERPDLVDARHGWHRRALELAQATVAGGDGSHHLLHAGRDLGDVSGRHAHP